MRGCSCVEQPLFCFIGLFARYYSNKSPVNFYFSAVLCVNSQRLSAVKFLFTDRPIGNQNSEKKEYIVTK